MTDSERTVTPVDTIAEAWVDDLAELAPTLATYIGRSEYDDRYGDLSPDGALEMGRRARTRRGELSAAVPVDTVDEVTKLDLSRELGLMAIAKVTESLRALTR